MVSRRHVTLLFVLPVLLGGCLYSRAQTDSPRTATEQLLLTRSAWNAVERLDLPEVEERTVAVEIATLAGDDANYLRVVLEERLRGQGARITASGDAELVVVVFAEALGTVSRGIEFGIPPVPLSGYTTPGLPFFRVLKQRGYTALRTVVRDGEQKVLATGGPVLARTNFEVYSVLFFAFRRNDIYPGEEHEFGVD